MGIRRIQADDAGAAPRGVSDFGEITRSQEENPRVTPRTQAQDPGGRNNQGIVCWRLPGRRSQAPVPHHRLQAAGRRLGHRWPQRPGPSVRRAVRGAGRDRLRRQRRAGDHRSDRRLAQRQAGPSAPRPVDCRGCGGHDGRCGVRLVYDFGPAEEWWARSGRRLARRPAARSRVCRSDAAATGGWRCWESSPPIRGGSRTGSTLLEGCAYRLRALRTIAPRCARSLQHASTAWCRCATAAASTLPPGS